MLVHMFLKLLFPCGKSSAINPASHWGYKPCYYVLGEWIARSLFEGDTDTFLQVNCGLVLLYHHESERCNLVKGGKAVSFLQPMK